MSGIILGSIDMFGTDANGCTWLVGSDGLTGWGSTGSTFTATQKTAGDGAWGSTKFRKPRLLSLAGSIAGPSSAAVLASLDNLHNVLAGTPKLTVDESAGPRYCYVEQQDAVLTSWVNANAVTFSFQAVSTDWRKFGPDATGATTLPSSTGGLRFPAHFPIRFSAVVNSGTIGLTNPGNTTGPVKLRIDGPCVGPIVSHIGTGQQLVFSSSYSIGSGNWLDIDMTARTVLENGQASRNGYITSRGWFGFEPGNNTFGFNASVYNSTARLTVSATPAWL